MVLPALGFDDVWRLKWYIWNPDSQLADVFLNMLIYSNVIDETKVFLGDALCFGNEKKLLPN